MRGKKHALATSRLTGQASGVHSRVTMVLFGHLTALLSQESFTTPVVVRGCGVAGRPSQTAALTQTATLTQTAAPCQTGSAFLGAPLTETYAKGPIK